MFTTLALGTLMDIVGLRIGVLGTSLALALGQLVVCFGVQIKAFWLVIIGRIIAGIAA